MPFVPEYEITQDALDKPHLWRMSQLGDHSKRVNAIHITKTGSHLTKMWGEGLFLDAYVDPTHGKSAFIYYFAEMNSHIFNMD